MKGKPGKVYLGNTSKKCADARALLVSLSSSPKLSLPIANALVEFDNTVGSNIVMFAVSLSESFALNHIPENCEKEVYEQGRAWNHYWGKFVNLKPKAEAVGLAIRAALESK